MTVAQERLESKAYLQASTKQQSQKYWLELQGVLMASLNAIESFSFLFLGAIVLGGVQVGVLHSIPAHQTQPVGISRPHDSNRDRTQKCSGSTVAIKACAYASTVSRRAQSGRSDEDASGKRQDACLRLSRRENKLHTSFWLRLQQSPCRSGGRKKTRRRPP